MASFSVQALVVYQPKILTVEYSRWKAKGTMLLTMLLGQEDSSSTG